MIKFKDTMGNINIHGDWRAYDFEESHTFMAGPVDEGGIPVYLFLEVCDLHSICGEEDGNKYAVEVSMVAPTEVSEKEKDEAKKSMGWPWGFEEGEPSEEQMARILFDYGWKGSIFSAGANSLRPIVRNAIREAQKASSRLHVYYDRPQNRLGSTAWEVMTGDILAPLYDGRTEATPEGRAIRKMYGLG